MLLMRLSFCIHLWIEIGLLSEDRKYFHRKGQESVIKDLTKSFT